MKIIIVDIDGTIAEKNPNRDIYDFSKVGLDYPIFQTIRVIQGMISEFIPVFVSGRKEIARKSTERWIMHYLSLGNHGYPNGSDLYMRADNDNRCDAIVKREIYEKHIKGSYDVFCVFDDRKKVIDMWRSCGLFVFNCSQLENNDF